ncbi:MAG TPA: hypothetical protein VE913_12920, partial [Longimicrobium sp.]|nr:hypothetical protein [Longimicrobium sp.]
MRRLTFSGLLALSLLPLASAGAQDIARQVAAAPDGEVTLTYPSQPNACRWDGAGDDGDARSGGQNWRDACVGGPVWVTISKQGGEVRGLQVTVGRPAPSAGRATDLGAVPPVEAAAYLVGLAGSSPRAQVGRQAVVAAVLANAPAPWEALLRVARNEDAPRGTRRAAVFWLGQVASRTHGAEIADVADRAGDREVQEEAVFALARRLTPENVTRLIRLARQHRDPAIRGKALFWLGYSSDSR